MKSEENKKEVKETENKVVKQGSDDLAEVKKALKKACDVCAAKIKEEYSGLKEEVKGLRSDYGDKVKIALAAYILLIALLVFVAVRLGNGSDTYVAGNSGSVQAYYVSDQAMRQSGLIQSSETYQVTRGTAVKRLSEKMKIGDDTYVRIKDSAAPLRRAIGFLKRGAAISACPDYQYISEASLTDNINDVVRETEVYVRTPATIYAEAEGPAIASFAPKGTCLKVTGFDKMNVDGSVHKYKVEYAGEDGAPAEGYVYGKYMTDTQEKADAVYNEGGIYDKVKKDNYDMQLYGGKAAHLDYYPYQKPVIEGNEFCEDARTMYLNCVAGTHPKNYIKIIKDTDCNAVVVDIKDGVLAYKSEVAKELSPRSYKTAYTSVEEYKKGIDALRESGVYLIGRIVVFNDPIYAKDHPEQCIIWGSNTGWPSAYSREVWEYNVRLAQEAVKEFGFNEIQFDYVRFPENSYEMSKSGAAKFHNKYDEEKGQAVQNFCFYAADQIHEAGAYFSVDVFGESAYGYMTAYGQYWPAISNIVDAISAMPYTDHMGGDGAWENPYGTMNAWAKRAAKRQKYLKDPAAARTWITGYDTPHWAPSVNYGKKQLKDQVKALKDQGLYGGFIPWNAGSSLDKYRQYRAVWNKD